jgi:hypothetical protein
LPRVTCDGHCGPTYPAGAGGGQLVGSAMSWNRAFNHGTDVR